MFIQL